MADESSDAAVASDNDRAEIVGPKDPEHGERPFEYAARVDAATTTKGMAHLEPTTTHYWGGNSEFRSTGVVPNLTREEIADDLRAEIKRHSDAQRMAAEGGNGGALKQEVPNQPRDESVEENTEPT